MTLQAPLLPGIGGPAKPQAARLVLAVLCGVAFTSNVIISLICPFLPQHFRAIGVHQVWCGVIFSSFPVAMLVCSPLAVRAMARAGRVPVLFFGLVLQGLSSIAFGYADELTGGPGAHREAAVAVYVLSRLACGGGGACANNAIFSVAADRFPETLGQVMGLNEVVIGVGFSLGPPLGASLYLAGGFGLPFLVAGSGVLAFAPVTLLLHRQPGSAPSISAGGEGGAAEGSLGEVLQPGLLVAGGCLFLGTAVFGIVEPILSLYLEEEVGIQPAGIGAVFGVFALAYSLVGPAMGALADRLGALRVCAAGSLAAGLTMALLLGPEARAFPRGSRARIGYEVGALVALGVASAATLIPSLPAMKDGVTVVGSSNITDRVVAWFNMFMQLGLAVGPIVGTALAGAVGFEDLVAGSGLVIAAYGAFASAYAAWPQPQPAPREHKARRSHSVTGTCISPSAARGAIERMDSL